MTKSSPSILSIALTFVLMFAACAETPTATLSDTVDDVSAIQARKPNPNKQPTLGAPHRVVSSSVHVPANGTNNTTVLCPTGEVVLGGGPEIVPPSQDTRHVRINQSLPVTVNGDEGWFAEAYNNVGSNNNLRVWAVCAPLTG